MEWSIAVELERYAVGAGEWVWVKTGFVMRVSGAVLLLDGVLRLDGAVKVN